MEQFEGTNFREWIANKIDDNDWHTIERYFNEGPLCQHMGFRISLKELAKPVCRIEEELPFHLGGIGQGYVNVAIISALFDFVIGLTGLRYACEGNFATTNVNITLAKPVNAGGVYVVAEIREQIGNKIFVESTLFDGKDEPCCYGTGELRIAIS